MADIVRAGKFELDELWNYNISQNPGDPRWVAWRDEYTMYNLSGKAQTYAVLADGASVGEGTLITCPDCKPVRDRLELCDGESVANVNALRIRKKYEGMGYMSRMIERMERDALNMGFSWLTIGVEAAETRNLAIYLHWGFTEFVCSETGEDGELVLYYMKKLSW